LSFFFQAEDGIRDFHVTGVQTCALPIYLPGESEVRRVHEPQYLAAQPRIGLDGPSVFGGAVVGILREFEQLNRALRQRGELCREVGRASCREGGEMPGADGAVEEPGDRA